MFFSKNNTKITPLPLTVFDNIKTATYDPPLSPKRSHMKHITKLALDKIKFFKFFLIFNKILKNFFTLLSQ